MPVAVAACIITYQRPRGLEKLLAHLVRQEGIAANELLVVVVDNDHERSAGAVIEAARIGGLAITYAHEPVPGIPRARNRSVELALRSGASRLCFIDDDEFPAATWLARLLGHADATSAPVVAGPVSSILPEGVPLWVKQSHLFSRPRHPTGERRDLAATNNVMVDRGVFETLDPWFDESRAFTGGEDTEFFRRAHRAGFAIEWCDEAVVYEDVQRDRCNLRWIGRRTLRESLDASSLAFRRGGVRWVARFATRGCLRIARGLLLGLVSLGLVPTLRLRVVEDLSSGVGLLLGLFGVTIEEYRRLPPRGYVPEHSPARPPAR